MLIKVCLPLIAWMPLIVIMCNLPAEATVYYLRHDGDDENNGTTMSQAWRTLERASQHTYRPGDTLRLESGQTFTGTLELKASSKGMIGRPIRITSTGKAPAIIDAGEGYGIRANRLGGLMIDNLVLQGGWNAETQSGNNGSGINLTNDLPGAAKLEWIRLHQLEASGFRDAGIRLASASPDHSKSGYNDVEISECEAHDNGSVGILCDGVFDEKSQSYSNSRIRILHCRVWNNRGLSENDNHSGSGILVGDVDDAVIEHCTAYRNGDLCRFKGGGPVGIWAWDCRHVIIQRCESYENQSGTIDGGGFDLDGGSVDSIMQYNYSHDNVGAGFLIAEFGGARPMHGNIVRFNLSYNDGRKNGYAGIQLWNGYNGLRETLVYHNTVVTSKNGTQEEPAALRFMTTTENTRVFNNIFITEDGLPLIVCQEKQPGLELRGNVFWSGAHPMKFRWLDKEIVGAEVWSEQTGLEHYGNKFTALIVDPRLRGTPKPGQANGRYDRPEKFQLEPDSMLRGKALRLDRPPYSFEIGKTDYFGNSLAKLTPISPGAGVK